MTSFKLNLNTIKNKSSRSAARKIREDIISLLKTYDCVEIDFENVILTPSLADEMIGVLAETFGSSLFKQKIKLNNISETQRALLKHVIASRIQKINFG